MTANDFENDPDSGERKVVAFASFESARNFAEQKGAKVRRRCE
jgi:hypothetical protein